MKIESPVEMTFLLFFAMCRVEIKKEIIEELEVHSLLKDSSDIEQYFGLLLRKRFFLLRIVKEIDGLSDLEVFLLTDVVDSSARMSTFLA